MVEKNKIKQLILFPIKCVLFIIGLFIFSLLKVLRPLIDIRIGSLFYSRIGHLSMDTELYLRQRVQGKYPPRQRHIFVSGEPVNHQLFTMIRRRVPIVKSSAALWLYRKFHNNSDLWITLPKESELFELGHFPPQLRFTAEEERKGEDLLADLGINSGAPFVCFHVRDRAYLEKMYPYDWSYHNYRDCDINNYLPAVKYLASLGIFVIRMGHIVEQALVTENPRIIDYATCCRSDFGDIYLSAKCKFFLASNSGLSSISSIFNVPIAYSNNVPLSHAIGLRKPDVVISKKLWFLEKKRFLTFREILACGADNWSWSEQYKQGGIEIVENTSEEILDLVKEMNARLDNIWIATEEDEELQRRYREIFPSDHNSYNSPSRVGAAFLRQNKELLK